MIVHVYPNSSGNNLSHTRINATAQRAPGQHRAPPPAATDVARNLRRERLEGLFFGIPIICFRSQSECRCVRFDRVAPYDDRWCNSRGEASTNACGSLSNSSKKSVLIRGHSLQFNLIAIRTARKAVSQA